MTQARAICGDQRGIALMIVLWTLMLLALLVVAFAQQTRLERQRVDNVIQTAKARSDLQAGLFLGIAGLLESAGASDWMRDGTARPVEFSGAQLEVAIQDANGCLDLNKAELGQILALLQEIGVARDVARSLAAAIVDWRDPDNVLTPNGAELSSYLQAGGAARPGNRPFLSVDELRGVFGMTTGIADRLSPLVTVFTAAPEVNPMTAPVSVLRALFPKGEVADILARRAARVSTAIDDESGSVTQGADLRSATAGDLADVAEGPVYMIDVAAGIPGGASARGRAVIWLTRDPKRPYHILDWQLPQPASDTGTTEP